MPIINVKLISHPMNWAIIILMLVIAGMGGHLLLSFLEKEPATGNDSKTPQGLSVEQMTPNSGAEMASLVSSQ